MQTIQWTPVLSGFKLMRNVSFRTHASVSGACSNALPNKCCDQTHPKIFNRTLIHLFLKWLLYLNTIYLPLLWVAVTAFNVCMCVWWKWQKKLHQSQIIIHTNSIDVWVQHFGPEWNIYILDGLQCNFVQTFTVLREWVLMTLMILWLFHQRQHHFCIFDDVWNVSPFLEWLKESASPLGGQVVQGNTQVVS